MANKKALGLLLQPYILRFNEVQSQMDHSNVVECVNLVEPQMSVFKYGQKMKE